MKRLILSKATLVGGLAAGVLDIIYALSRWNLAGIPPVSVLQTIAGGVLGSEAYKGGIATALMGLAFHFLLTITMAGLFVLASRHITYLRRAPLLVGSIYGGIIYLMMNRVVLPLSNYPPPQPTVLNLPDLAAHIFLVGIPIALARRKWEECPEQALLAG